MTESLPSKRIIILDVPEVAGFRATFVYGFFTPDESIDTRVGTAQVVKSSASDPTIADRRRLPRFVKFDFTPSTSHEPTSGNEFVARGSAADVPSISKNLTSIQSEEGFSTNDFTGIEFQDSNVDAKLLALVSGSIAKRVTSLNRNIQSGIDEARSSILSNLTDEHSLLDAARALAADTSSGVSNDVVVTALNQLDELRMHFIDDSTQSKITSDAYAAVRDVKVRGQFNSKVVGVLVKEIADDPMNQFSDEFAALKRSTDRAQLMTLARSNPGIISRSEFTTYLMPVATRPGPIPVTVTRIVGYIIEKSEVQAQGRIRSHPPIVIERATVGTAIDPDVVYGRTYIYTIRTVAQIETQGIADDSTGVNTVTGLVKSQRSPRQFVECVEEVPPPPPSDFNVMWDYQIDRPILLWSFPPNSQRDIKRFQVFKRASLTEPFRLLREIDFDDSRVRMQGQETPDPALVDRLSSPVATFVDRTFRPGHTAIYTLCSIDAHGMSSNYSIQFSVTFQDNAIRKSLVSTSGAPKAYPNMLLNQDLFSDTMRDSGHTRMRVFFDPEFLRVTDNRDNDRGLLALENRTGGTYQLQVINTDVQRQGVVKLRVKDRRTRVGR